MNNKTKKRSKMWIVWVVLAVIVLAFAVPAIGGAKTPSGNEVSAKTGDITTYYSFSGSVEAKNRQMIYAEQAAQISDFKVKEGAAVKKDDVLYVTKTGTNIKSPIGGVVLEIYAQKGEQMMPGAKILEVVDYSNLQLKVQVDENDLAAIKKDVKATVTVNALSKDFEGTVAEVSKEGIYSNGVTYFTATISIPKDDNIKVGMSAEAKVSKDKATDVVVLPMSAIRFDDNNEAYVYTRDEKGKLDKVKVVLGITDGSDVEIKYGVTANDKVFVPKEETTAGTPGGFGPMRGGDGDDGNDSNNSNDGNS